MASSPQSQSEYTTVARVSIKAPEFWQSEPELWFYRIEAQFRQARITTDSCKFDHTVASLNSDVLLEAADILRCPIEGRSYEDLKARLLERFGLSPEERTRKMLEMSLGDLQPSQLLHRMQGMAPTIDSQLIKTLWLERLPTQIRGTISVLEGSLEELAKKADQFLRTAGSQVYTIEDTNPILADLANQVAALGKRIGNNHSTSSSDSNSECFYHKTFGKKARKCRPPCIHFTKNDVGEQ